MTEKRGKLALPPAHAAHAVHSAHHSNHENVPHASGTIESNLVANLIMLQKTHLAFVEKFDNLSKQMSDLLALFELSAQTFAKQLDPSIVQKDAEFAEKIDQILEQNKIIAKSISLIEERIRPQAAQSPNPQQTQQQMPQMQQRIPAQNLSGQQYTNQGVPRPPQRI